MEDINRPSTAQSLNFDENGQPIPHSGGDYQPRPWGGNHENQEQFEHYYNDRSRRLNGDDHQYGVDPAFAYSGRNHPSNLSQGMAPQPQIVPASQQYGVSAGLDFPAGTPPPTTTSGHGFHHGFNAYGQQQHISQRGVAAPAIRTQGGLAGQFANAAAVSHGLPNMPSMDQTPNHSSRQNGQFVPVRTLSGVGELQPSGSSVGGLYDTSSANGGASGNLFANQLRHGQQHSYGTGMYNDGLVTPTSMHHHQGNNTDHFIPSRINTGIDNSSNYPPRVRSGQSPIHPLHPQISSGSGIMQLQPAASLSQVGTPVPRNVSGQSGQGGLTHNAYGPSMNMNGGSASYGQQQAGSSSGMMLPSLQQPPLSGHAMSHHYHHHPLNNVRSAGGASNMHMNPNTPGGLLAGGAGSVMHDHAGSFMPHREHSGMVPSSHVAGSLIHMLPTPTQGGGHHHHHGLMGGVPTSGVGPMGGANWSGRLPVSGVAKTGSGMAPHAATPVNLESSAGQTGNNRLTPVGSASAAIIADTSVSSATIPNGGAELTLEELALTQNGYIGKVLAIAHDQQGCRALQTRLESGDEDVIGSIFAEMRTCLPSLMIDPFGNYLCQKLLEVCNEVIVAEIVRVVKGDLAAIALNSHGTRAAQKLVEVVAPLPERYMVIEALKDEVVKLVLDLHGNHVIQKCLHSFGFKDNEFIFKSVAAACRQVSTHRHGCCVFQRCLDASAFDSRSLLISRVQQDCTFLVRDPFGNYVVQYILKIESPSGPIPASSSDSEHLTGAAAEFNQGVCAKVVDTILQEASISDLTCQKFSSNVVEQCLTRASPTHRAKILERILKLTPEGIKAILQDPFGNYVIQRALSTGSGPSLSKLAIAVAELIPTVKSSASGKRVAAKILKRFPFLSDAATAGAGALASVKNRPSPAPTPTPTANGKTAVAPVYRGQHIGAYTAKTQNIVEFLTSHHSNSTSAAGGKGNNSVTNNNNGSVDRKGRNNNAISSQGGGAVNATGSKSTNPAPLNSQGHSAATRGPQQQNQQQQAPTHPLMPMGFDPLHQQQPLGANHLQFPLHFPTAPDFSNPHHQPHHQPHPSLFYHHAAAGLLPPHLAGAHPPFAPHPVALAAASMGNPYGPNSVPRFHAGLDHQSAAALFAASPLLSRLALDPALAALSFPQLDHQASAATAGDDPTTDTTGANANNGGNGNVQNNPRLSNSSLIAQLSSQWAALLGTPSIGPTSPHRHPLVPPPGGDAAQLTLGGDETALDRATAAVAALQQQQQQQQLLALQHQHRTLHHQQLAFLASPNASPFLLAAAAPGIAGLPATGPGSEDAAAALGRLPPGNYAEMLRSLGLTADMMGLMGGNAGPNPVSLPPAAAPVSAEGGSTNPSANSAATSQQKRGGVLDTVLGSGAKK